MWRSWPPSCPTFTVLSFTVATIHSVSNNHQCSSAASLSTRGSVRQRSEPRSYHLMIRLTLLNAIRRTHTPLKITILPQLWVKLIKETNDIKKWMETSEWSCWDRHGMKVREAFTNCAVDARHQWLLFSLHPRLKDDDAQTVLWHLGRTSECRFTLL